MVTSSAVFVSCYTAYERELLMTKQLMMAQSRPVTAEEMMAAEREHVAKLTAASNSASTAPSSESK